MTDVQPIGGVVQAFKPGANPANTDDIDYADDGWDDVWTRLIPQRFRHASVASLTGDFAAAVTDWRQDWSRNLLFLGDVGVGKTYAAVAAARLAHQRRLTVAFWPVVELLDAIRPGGDADALERACSRDVLILDDLGGEKPSDWTGERLYMLVNRRWLEGRPTIATSNLNAHAGKGPLVDAVGARTYSRLVHGAVVVRVTGADRRRFDGEAS